MAAYEAGEHTPEAAAERTRTWLPASRLLALALWRAGRDADLLVDDIPLHRALWWLGVWTRGVAPRAGACSKDEAPARDRQVFGSRTMASTTASEPPIGMDFMAPTTVRCAAPPDSSDGSGFTVTIRKAPRPAASSMR
ncbi:hypothetical protein GCM10009864_50310 [Streptomyces lunalinharesii]|uniref:Uncharacterized protein n=1 Tax=Streptomyces lunalinharesii TaxID=333384 RepID=A0ABN3SE96_9ACTN